MDEKNLDKDIAEEKVNNVVDEDDDDIEFDDNIDLDAITKQLQQHVNVEDNVEVPTANGESEVLDLQIQDDKLEDIQILPDLTEENKVIETKEIDNSPVQPKTESIFDDFPKSECKKYVIYITPNNIKCIDNMTIDERTKLINDIIYEKNNSDEKKKAIQERQRYFKHLLVVCVTIIVSFPLLFFAVNKALSSSMYNYQQSQENFQKLYKEKGKISTYQQMNLRD